MHLLFSPHRKRHCLRSVQTTQPVLQNLENREKGPFYPEVIMAGIPNSREISVSTGVSKGTWANIRSVSDPHFSELPGRGEVSLHASHSTNTHPFKQLLGKLGNQKASNPPPLG